MRWRQRESERAHNKHVTKGQRQCKRKKMMMMMTRTGKKVTKCWHRFFISFHFMPFHSMLFYSVLFLYAVIYVSSYDDVDMLCPQWTCLLSPILPLSFSLHIFLCVIIIKMPWPGGRLCKIFWCLKVTERQEKEKKPELNWHLIRESTKGFRWPKQNVFNLF